MKQNGFSLRVHAYQFVSFVLQASNVALAAILTVSYSVAAYWLVVYGVMQVLLIVTAICASMSNPVFQGNTQLEFYCSDCEVLVSATSRHCKRCGKCIEQFDHHCKLINNCIGKSNYKTFIALIMTLEIEEISVLALFIIFSTELSGAEDLVLPSALLVAISVNFLVLCLNGYLIGLHIYLFHKNLTTYQFFTGKPPSHSRSSFPIY